MAIVVPTGLPLVSWEDLLGDVALDDQPLDTILDAVNYLYANHRPALWAFSPVGVASAAHDWVWHAMPSADALTYDIHAYLYNQNSKIDTLNLTLSYGASSSGPWTAVTGWNPKAVSMGGAGSVETWYSATAALPAGSASTEFWRLQVSESGGMNTQVQYFAALPARVPSITAGKKASGFVAYDNTMLQAAAGGTIHTELFDRCVKNVAAILQDRGHAVASYVDDKASAVYTFARATGRSVLDWLWVFRGRTSVLGQGGGPGIGARLKVYARANDTDAGGNGVLIVGEEGGDSVELDLDDSDSNGTFDLRLDRPVLYAKVHPHDTGAVSVRYISIEYVQGYPRL